MKYIAHRGLTEGPDSELENRPDQILKSLAKGYHCEIDVRFVGKRWMLGHDNPDYEIPFEFLEHPSLWIHAKNLDALYILGASRKLNFFWHQEDDFTLTSKGYIWTYPGKELTEDSILVMPEYADKTLENAYTAECYAICSDYIIKIELERNKLTKEKK